MLSKELVSRCLMHLAPLFGMALRFAVDGFVRGLLEEKQAAHAHDAHKICFLDGAKIRYSRLVTNGGADWVEGNVKGLVNNG
jgi:hypothetical protein